MLLFIGKLGKFGCGEVDSKVPAPYLEPGLFCHLRERKKNSGGTNLINPVKIPTVTGVHTPIMPFLGIHTNSQVSRIIKFLRTRVACSSPFSRTPGSESGGQGKGWYFLDSV